ncbi:MAG: phage tail protein [Silvanigrellaceae bacterium]
MKAAAVVLGTLLSTSAFASECYLGEVRSFALLFPNTELEGFVRADGQLLQIFENQALYSLLGNRYGGDSRTTFAVPNLNSPNEKVVHFICTVGIYPSRR